MGINGLGKVTEFRDYFKIRVDRLMRRLCWNAVSVRDKAEKGCSLCRHLSVRFFVANNLNLIYNRYNLAYVGVHQTASLHGFNSFLPLSL